VRTPPRHRLRRSAEAPRLEGAPAEADAGGDGSGHRFFIRKSGHSASATSSERGEAAPAASVREPETAAEVLPFRAAFSSSVRGCVN
jgi:hypothetical protein